MLCVLKTIRNENKTKDETFRYYYVPDKLVILNINQTQFGILHENLEVRSSNILLEILKTRNKTINYQKWHLCTNCEYSFQNDYKS